MPLTLGRAGRWLRLAIIAAAALGCREATAPASADAELAAALAAAGVMPLAPVPTPPRPLAQLGQALFFDKLLSGNRDVSCATCHNPIYHTSDALPLSIGSGGHLPGASRQLGQARGFTPRGAPDLFLRGRPEWKALFWDGRVEETTGGFVTPAGAALPSDLTSLLAAQAMLPVAGRAEMRGYPGDLDRYGAPNELALLADSDFTSVWRGLMARLLAVPGYCSAFAAAFPGADIDTLGFSAAANAIAAFIADRWANTDSPFDRYLAGDQAALADSARQGALLFFGRAGCAACHRGPLLTDQRYHNIGVPELGPGIGASGHDLGREEVSLRSSEAYAFRTPQLRNVALTGPWMHNGAYPTLDAAVRLYRDPRAALLNFDAAQVDPRLSPTLRTDPATIDAILATLDPLVQVPRELSDGDIADLVAFLRSLTDPAAINQLDDLPPNVPSGLPLFDY